MSSDHNRVCPVHLAGSLDNRLRRLVQNPRRILSPYLKPGMTALDMGCGPGFFTLDMALLVGEQGRVWAVDMQEGMLEKVRAKIAGTELEERIRLHLCPHDSIGIPEAADFALLFYMVHEVPDQGRLFAQVARVLKPGGRVLVVEPPFHVFNRDFDASMEAARLAGLSVVERRGKIMDKVAVLKRV